MSEAFLVAAAILGPALSAAVWLAVGRWPAVRWATAGLFALASVAAAWAVLWAAYRGGAPAWRGLAPGLLPATLVAVGEVGIVLAALRADRLAPAAAPAAIAALGVGTSAFVVSAYAQNLALVAVFLVVPTLAGLIASLGNERRRLPGIASLAAADVVAVIGLSVVYSRTETIAFAPASGLGVGLLLGAAAAKAGALPGLATARLAAAGDAGAVMTPVLRAQGVALAALAGLAMSSGDPGAPLAVAAAVTMLASGVASVLSRTGVAAVAGLAGAAAGVPFLALGLGGAVGVRSFLLAAPPFLLASALAESLTPRPGEDAAPPAAAGFRWAGVLALGVGVGSLAGIPPGGGLPGTWLALALGVTRALTDPVALLVVGGALVGLALALVAAAPVVRAAVPRPAASIVGTLAALGLLYLGAQPLRLAVGWWLRVETSLALPRLLPSAGAPEVPVVGGMTLLLVAAPALAVVAAVAALGRGLRDAPAAFPAPIAQRPRRRVRRGEPLPVRERIAAGASALVERTRALGIGVAVAAVVAAGALVLAGRLVWNASRGGFL